MTSSKLKEVKKQTRFCAELMARIKDEVDRAEVYPSGYVELLPYRTASDVIRLRRELNELRKILVYPY